jgi:hypothetical protein
MVGIRHAHPVPGSGRPLPAPTRSTAIMADGLSSRSRPAGFEPAGRGAVTGTRAGWGRAGRGRRDRVDQLPCGLDWSGWTPLRSRRRWAPRAPRARHGDDVSRQDLTADGEGGSAHIAPIRDVPAPILVSVRCRSASPGSHLAAAIRKAGPRLGASAMATRHHASAGHPPLGRPAAFRSARGWARVGMSTARRRGAGRCRMRAVRDLVQSA